MAAIQQSCVHQEHGGSQQFELYVRKLIKKFRDSNDQDTCTDILEILSEKIDTGICQHCTMHTMYHLVLVSINQLSRITDRLMHHMTLSLTFLFLLSGLQYPSIAKFVFNQSNLWNILLSSFALEVRHLTASCQYEMQQMQRPTGINRAFHLLYHFALKLLDHCALMGNKHWNILFKVRSSLNTSYFEIFLEFMELQFSTGFYLNYEFVGGNDHVLRGMRCLLILLSFGASFLKNHCGAHENSNLLLVRFGQIILNSQSSPLALYKNQNLKNWNIVQPVQVMYELNRNMAVQSWNLRWMDMKCARVGCKVKRKDNDKLYKCKK